MPAPHDLDPDAMTENERLEKRRGEAGFAFEMMPQSRFDHFNKGATDHLPEHYGDTNIIDPYAVHANRLPP